ncbi:hypothetical protein [Pseudoalteromonas phage J2-1_QLiu-2017]|nr:hypothetical protein [Pseudoalteromonas phage J2-1_QLiu-2017]
MKKLLVLVGLSASLVGCGVEKKDYLNSTEIAMYEALWEADSCTARANSLARAAKHNRDNDTRPVSFTVNENLYRPFCDIVPTLRAVDVMDSCTSQGSFKEIYQNITNFSDYTSCTGVPSTVSYSGLTETTISSVKDITETPKEVVRTLNDKTQVLDTLELAIRECGRSSFKLNLLLEKYNKVVDIPLEELENTIIQCKEHNILKTLQEN